jgi:hypothetical protein
VSLDDGQDTFLLDWGGLVETITIDSPENFLFKTHVVKAIDGLVPVGLEVVFIYLRVTMRKPLTFFFLLLLFFVSNLGFLCSFGSSI